MKNSNLIIPRRSLLKAAPLLVLPRVAKGQFLPARGYIPGTSSPGFSLVNSVGAAAPSATGTATTAAINTNTSNLIVIGGGCYHTSPVALTDSQNNTWTVIGPVGTNGSQVAFLAYCFNPSTSASHTFSFAGNNYAAIGVEAWSGSIGSGTYDQTNNGSATGSSTNTIACGNITPTANNELIAAVFVGGTTALTSSPTLNNGTIRINEAYGANNLGLLMTDYIQSTAAAINQTVTSTTGDWSSVTVLGLVASFKS